MLYEGVPATYTMMLLMGMWMSLTKKPMNPMMAKPIAVAMAIFWNSVKMRNNQSNHSPFTTCDCILSNRKTNV